MDRNYLVRISAWGVLLALTACGAERNVPGEQAATQSEAGERLEPAEASLRAHATISGPPGSGIKGEVTFVQLKENLPAPGVEIEARITAPASELASGPHGLHIHENAKGGCVPPYESAEGHFDPGPSGNSDPDVNHPFHTGDIPNLMVDQNGAGSMKATTSRITLSPGPLTVFDADGSVIIVHENPDRGTSGPAKSGVSGGGRIACGVIELNR